MKLLLAAAFLAITAAPVLASEDIYAIHEAPATRSAIYEGQPEAVEAAQESREDYYEALSDNRARMNGQDPDRRERADERGFNN